MVAAFPTLHRPAEQFFFRGVIELLVFDGKAADRIAIEIGQRVLQKDMSVLRELWIERESKKPALLLGVDLQLPHGFNRLRFRVEQAQLPIEFVKIDFPVRCHLHGHWAVKVGADNLVAIAEVFGFFSRKRGVDERECEKDGRDFHGADSVRILTGTRTIRRNPRISLKKNPRNWGSASA